MLHWSTRGATNFQAMYQYFTQRNPNLLNKEKPLYTDETFLDLASKLQTKVNEMTDEMNQKSDELDNHIEDVNQVKGTFEEIEHEIQELLDAINEMADFESRIEEAVNEADNLIH